eukprot:1024507-Pleurochrysis_carterae.AAC.2
MQASAPGSVEPVPCAPGFVLPALSAASSANCIACAPGPSPARARTASPPALETASPPVCLMFLRAEPSAFSVPWLFLGLAPTGCLK